MAGNITQRAAGNLAEKIKQGKLNNGFTARIIRQKNWSLLTDMEVIRGALSELVEAHWLDEIKKSTDKIGGRPSVIYFINDKVKNLL